MDVQHFTAADGARIAYRDEGQGLPVLCLAGLTRSMDDFDYLAPTLAGCRMIRMDYRGRGQSDWTGAATYTVPQEGADALALLDHLGIAKAAIVGTSRGGLIAMYLAAVAKDRLLGVCLNDVGPQLRREGLEAIMDYVGRRPTARTLAEVAERLPRTLRGFGEVPEGRWVEEAARLYRQAEDGVTLTYDPALREALNQHLLEGAQRLTGRLREGVTTHIAQTVKGWDERHLVEQLELSVGRDLQFIRFNGTLVGGLIGLLLHAATVVFRF